MSSSILITGGSSGLGLELAKLYAAEGAEVFVLDCDPPPETSFPWTFLRHDLSEEISDAFLSDQPPVTFDLVLCNAGISASGPVSAMSWKTQKQVFDVNALGHLHLLHWLLQHGRIKEHGHIAFTLSAATFTPVPITAAYSASKCALEGFALAAEPWLRESGIAVTRIYPGQMQTPHLRKYYGMEELTGARPAIVAKRIRSGLRQRKRTIYPDSMSHSLRLASFLAPWALRWGGRILMRKRFPEYPASPSSSAAT
ncbi:MAG: SDR family NAD(P)-dependent oxidoreductase [Verrucomicrobiota bacterium]